jgi:hypothetical protein
VPIERHARSIYTRAVYHIFREEIYKAGNYRIKERMNDYTFVLVHTMFDENPKANLFKVTIRYSEVIHCSCGLYEHKGMLCRHSLKVR